MIKRLKFLANLLMNACTAMMTGLLLFTLSIFPARAEDGWLTGTLRTDLSTIKTAQDYIHYVTAMALPNSYPNYMDGYLKIYAVPNSGPPSSSSMEVGISIEQPQFTLPGRYWYVHSTYSVQCLRGSAAPNGHHCSGLRGDSLTSTSSEYRLELVTYGSGFWIARVKNVTTNEIADVAKIYIPQTTIANLFASTYINEMAGGVSTGILRHRYTQYMYGGFQVWPTSFNGNNNTLIANSLGTTCPNTYSGKTNYNGDIRA